MPVTRQPTPELLNTPSPNGRYANFASYVDHCVELVGSAFNLGKMLRFTSGTRVSDWRSARGGRPSMASCIRLAKLTSDHPLDIMVMGGWAEEAGLLREWMVDGARPTGLSVAQKLKPLNKINEAIEALAIAKQALQES